MRSLENKVAIVTGSTSGIGKGIALHLASLGVRVVVTGRDLVAGKDVVEAIKECGGKAAFCEADLTDVERIKHLVEFAVTRYQHVDILVNNAADTSRGTIENTTVEQFDRQVAINVRAPFFLIQECAKHMKKTGGAILNIGSVNAYIGEPKLCAYSVTKGALMTLTKNSAAQLSRHKIRVNQLNVGWTLTEGEERAKAAEGKADTWLEEALATRPFGRMLMPRDIANAAAYFVSDQAECVTGSVMDLEQYPVGAPPNW